MLHAQQMAVFLSAIVASLCRKMAKLDDGSLIFAVSVCFTLSLLIVEQLCDLTFLPLCLAI